MRFVLSGASTWIGHRGQVACVRQGAMVERRAVGNFGLEPAFDANQDGCFSLTGDWLLDPEGRRLGSILEGQTWFRVGERLGIGFYRAGGVTVYFLFHTARAGLKRLNLPPLRGRLVDAAAAFDDERVLLEVSCEAGGQLTRHLWVIDAGGEVLAKVIDGVGDRLPAPGGKAIVGDRVVYASDQGLATLLVDRRQRTVIDGPVFSDAEPFVRSGATVFPGPGGAVYVATTRDVLHLTWMR